MGSRTIRITILLPINQTLTDDKRFEFSLFRHSYERMGEQTGSETRYNENIKPQNMIKHHINMLLSKLDSYTHKQYQERAFKRLLQRMQKKIHMLRYLRVY
jgi:glutamate mutase epsilon subunit